LVDSYSAFFENDGTSTGLSGFLRARGIRRVLVCGLAGDYCVLWTVQDAVREGFEVFFDLSLTRFVDFPSGSRQKAEEYLSNFLFH
jgi:nicotinamidase/pyrazinamidase